MSKTRVNFLIDEKLYQLVQSVAVAEDSSAADIFRKAARKYVYEYNSQGQAKFYSKEKLQSIAEKEEEIYE